MRSHRGGYGLNRQRAEGISDSFKGYTLVELLVAALVTSLVLSLAGFGVIAATQSNKRTEAIAARRHDLSRAFDFISNEIRMAIRINQSQMLKATNASSMSNVLTSAGLDSSIWSNPVLYLETPILLKFLTFAPLEAPMPFLHRLNRLPTIRLCMMSVPVPEIG
ncbi:PulJ/GspJ family protein [Acaryochloris marina]|uniref:Prepilin-type N-terminal cleavage/methylation domain-containing protein n=1 Tax=Acaryochloris marina (strain MBIC 11017) TaxID=329726 RepID=B0C0K2_ACAM1|nr:prepilin-type N-terminal cleavage/methylation domain-containing protein [Acaryochloris marina]ABW30795.1 hypothetical protein AM1_5854 [Acaryochloris marina MBIC11017]BDM79549.1 hypothetical protein AM10699_24170 [Acaryochloris marina MBIC10699]